MHRKKITFLLLRILTGAIFILSALFKFMDIDLFELYVFGQHLLNFNLSAIAARLIICTEFFIGIMLITGIYFRTVYRFTITLLAAFSLFLIIQIIQGNTGENCHCFGELVKLTPLESLIKNLVIGIILFFIRKNENTEFRLVRIVASSIFLISFTVPTIISAPDFLFSFNRDKPDFLKTSEAIRENEQLNDAGATSSKKLVCFFSVTCPYCEMASSKISIIVANHQLEEQTIYVFAGSPADLPAFLEKGGKTSFNHLFLDMHAFFNIAGPVVPSIFLVDNGKVVEQYNYRDINENELVAFLSK